MKILISGAAGFLGYHLAEHYRSKGHEVIGIDNFFHPCNAPAKDVHYGDIRYLPELLKAVEWADLVCHLAAQIHVDRSIEIPDETTDVNVRGTVNVLEACRKYKKRIIFASTSEIYGSSQSSFMDESHPLDPQSPYGASKAAGDRYCKAYADTYGLEAIILRNFNTFGEWQNDTSYGAVIAKFTKAALTDQPLTIFGDGSQERDYMGVRDAVQAYEVCAEAGEPGEAYNAGSGRTVSIKMLAEMIIGLTKSKSAIIHTSPRPGEVKRLCAKTDKIKSLGFMPTSDFEQDLMKYIGWYAQTYKLGHSL
jgi:nucleoside-diphosphate-sugar epimerase